jgi:hypothetical protein
MLVLSQAGVSGRGAGIIDHDPAEWRALSVRRGGAPTGALPDALEPGRLR